MYSIVGLGNPGEEYTATRHNIGWRAVTHFIEEARLPNLVRSGTFNALISEGVVGGHQVGVLLPTTFMNNSGSSVQKYLSERKSTTSELVVVHDDVDLPFGKIRISVGRGGGGHNGVGSIIESLGTQEFIRVRIGVAKIGFLGGVVRPKGDRLADFVLGTFTRSEEKEIPEILARAHTAIMYVLKEGVVEAMNVYNA